MYTLANLKVRSSAETDLQIDALSLTFDWLISNEHRFDWLTVLFSQYQFENPSESKVYEKPWL